jgi:hypothetical protein
MQDREIDDRLKAGLRRKISIAARRLALGARREIVCSVRDRRRPAELRFA